MEEYLKFLEKYISFQTVSTDGKHLDEIRMCVDWLGDVLQTKGFEVLVDDSVENPIILAEKIVNPELPTCIVYGHYDVQPVGKIESWFADPFKIHKRGDRLFARGVADNKGQFAIHAQTIFELLQKESLGFNVKFLIEGEEEIGSPNMPQFINKNLERLNCDLMLVSDGNKIGKSWVVEAGLRGIFNFELELTTSTKELHSGMFGGGVPNAAQEMANVLTKLVKDNNYVNIPGFYDEVKAYDLSKKIDANTAEILKLAGTKTLFTGNDLNFFEQVGSKPTLQITGLDSGYTGKGIKSVIPNTAIAKINIRLVANQTLTHIESCLKEFLEKNIPDYVDYSLSITKAENVEAVVLDLNNEYIRKAETIFKSSEQDFVYDYVGGTIPLIKFFQEKINKPQILIPLANEDCGMHAVNENLTLLDIEQGLEFSKAFFLKNEGA